MKNTANFLDITMLRNGDLELKWEIKPEQGVNYLLKLNILISELLLQEKEFYFNAN